ncbi:MAG TPA: alanine--tRNA ligase [Syntrophorhabdaceae bacterium]|nr:alanine--tRNA ligase [Syntrophorhabdaceae bacterium]
MTSNEIRRLFLDYFADNNHTIVPSSPLVPEKDPTLLFVNAGMVQFKNIFLGIEKRDYIRATSCQKCVRAGGKHNDLDNVGKTLRHHTFFEMLGNFSFGDYFKKEAIAYAWRFLRDVLNLDEKRLWITIYKDDEDAAMIWRQVGVKEERIIRLGEKDNFWSMGDEGPCGPCSEIVYDLGVTVGCKRPNCMVGCDCDRFLEIWNLVFMEFERQKDGTMKRLPRPSIDTGMGLERIASVLQKKVGNYETDLFVPILKRIEDISGLTYGEVEKTDIAMRVIADHVRSATFIINDGVLPSKEGRGYVLRRIIRRALRYGKKIGIEKEFLHTLSSVVVDIMEDAYPEIKQNHAFIVRVLKGEEERFLETLNIGMRLYEEIAEDLKSKGLNTIPGSLIYKLYDTYGFPVDITREMAEDDGLSLDMAGFEEELKAQKERSRIASKIKGDELEIGHIEALKADLKNRFVGYERLYSTGKVLAIIIKDQSVEALGENEVAELFFDTTPFYAESGGQVEDVGLIKTKGGEALVIAVKKVRQDLFAHKVKVIKGEIKIGDTGELYVDVEKRKAVSRNHTATHLLHYALRTVLGDHVKQAGSLVEGERFRFDFTHFQGLSEAELARVEDIVNEKILDCIDVKIEEKTREDAIKEGAIALFEEKYGEMVRVVKIGDFSAELCGGTHVRNTGEIGSFYIIGESSLAAGVRRIEAVTGKGSINFKRRIEGILKNLSKQTNTEIARLEDKITGYIEELKEKEKTIERLKTEIISYKIEDAIKSAHEKDGIKIVTLFLENATIDDLRKATDIVRSKEDRSIVAAGSKDELKGTVIVAVSKGLQNQYNAGKLLKTLAERFHGKGGGGPNIAQGGLPPENIKHALKDFYKII